jgi:hypothetical protein
MENRTKLGTESRTEVFYEASFKLKSTGSVINFTRKTVKDLQKCIDSILADGDMEFLSADKVERSMVTLIESPKLSIKTFVV